MVPMLSTPQPGSLCDRRHIDRKQRQQQAPSIEPTRNGDAIIPDVPYTTDRDIYPSDAIFAIAAKNSLSQRATEILRNLLAAYHVDPVALCHSQYENPYEYEGNLTPTESTLLFALGATFVARHQHEFSERPRRKKEEATIRHREGLVPVL